MTFQLVRSGTDPNDHSPVFDLRGLGTQSLQCLIRALEREANEGDRYLAGDLLKAIGEQVQGANDALVAAKIIAPGARVAREPDPPDINAPHLTVYFTPSGKSATTRVFAWTWTTRKAPEPMGTASHRPKRRADSLPAA